MSGIYGLLGFADGDLTYVNTVGQRLVFDAANEYLRIASDERGKAYTAFVQEQIENHKERYKLPGGGRLQERGGLAPSGATKAYGGWDVAYPLKEYGASIANSRVAMAYMTIADVQRHLDTVTIQAAHTMRHEILRRILKNTTDTFVDPRDDVGSLTIQCLANGDSVTYPPVLGSETEATDTHYLESNYAAASISETNNPLITIREELEEHFGMPTGYGNIVVMINKAQIAKVEALTDYDQVKDSYIQLGSNADVPSMLPAVPGRVLGRSNGVWVVQWDWVPANYMIGLDLDVDAPLKMRVDLASTGLPRGLTMVADSDKYPIQESHFVDRYGFGAGNRLNGVVMELGTGGTYTIPTGYTT